MTVHPVRPDSTARSAPRLISIAPQRPSRLTLYDRVVTAICDALALTRQAYGEIGTSRAYGLRADAHVDAIDRIALRMAQEADALGDAVALRRALSIRQHVVGYHAEDDLEDQHRDEGAGGLLRRLGRVLRAVNEALSNELAKRGVKGGQP